MNGIELINYLRKDITCWSRFNGIFAIDKLNFTIPHTEGYYICNTDESFKRGKHWVVIYISKNARKIEYFDSLGKIPLNRFIKFMQTRNLKIAHNTKRLQSVSSLACGYFCLYFIYLRSRGISLAYIINNFSSSLNNNEKYVISFVKQNFK